MKSALWRQPWRQPWRQLFRAHSSEVTLEHKLSAVASTAHRLAVLLAAGIAPHSAWRYLDAEAVPIAARVAEAVDAGIPVPAAILSDLSSVTPDGTVVSSFESDAWRSLAAAWQVAITAGAPLAPALRAIASALRAVADARREVNIALAGPVSTARMVMSLPAVAVLFGILLGFDPLRTLFTTPFGLGCLVVGVVLIVGAARWNRHLVAAAQPGEVNPGLCGELTAIAVSGGASMSKARVAVTAALKDCGILVDPHDEAAVERIIELSSRAGVPAAELLKAEAEERRRLARAHSAQKAVVLSVRLMLPLGLCILPAFMVLGVAPLMLALISSTVISF